jgi:hypothetical protein
MIRYDGWLKCHMYSLGYRTQFAALCKVLGILSCVVQVQTNLCARVGNDSRIDLDECDMKRIPRSDSVFELTADGRLMVTSSGQCLAVNSSNYVFAGDCKEPLDKQQVRNVLPVYVVSHCFIVPLC